MDNWSMLATFGLILVIALAMWLLRTYVGMPISNKCSSFLQQDSLYTLGPLRGGDNVKSYYYENTSNDKAKEKTVELQNLSLKEFYVKSAYNCCALGKLKYDYVDICALKYCIKHGARCLDFEIYSIKRSASSSSILCS